MRNESRADALPREEIIVIIPDLPRSPTPDPDWLISEEGFDLAREHEIESLFVVGNGFLGTRGSLAEGSPLSSPATFLAGLYETDPRSDGVPRLVIIPDWTRIDGFLDGQELRLDSGEVLEHRRVLDLRQGILWREWRHRDLFGRITRIRGLRLASRADRHLLLQSIHFHAENYSGAVVLKGWIRSGIGPDEQLAPVAEESAMQADADRQPLQRPTPPRITTLSLTTADGKQTIALAITGEVLGTPAGQVQRRIDTGPGEIRESWTMQVLRGRGYRWDRAVCVYTSRESQKPAESATTCLLRCSGEGFDRAIDRHVDAWARCWGAAEVSVEGDRAAQRALRFAAYHLISAGNPHDASASIGARALTGPAYLGHVFWDTELFLFPFYLFTHPAAARALLSYRYHTLTAAREKAQRLGYRGAFFAWESADSGVDVTPRFVFAPNGEVVSIPNGDHAVHISAAIAYAVCHYWHATRDAEFLREMGAEIVLETARFWASRGQLEADGRFHIRDVVGPDEYHENVDDSAYTNLMAQWNLERGAAIARLVRERWPGKAQELATRIGIDDDEIRNWELLASRMFTGFDPATGLFEQFQGYFGLEQIDLDLFEPRTTALDVLLGRARVQQSQVVKQADVIMALHLLWDRFPPEVRELNFRYYEPRTGHGSSLSPAIHAAVAGRLGERELALRYFRQAAEIDLADRMGNAAGGVHIGALGGLWQAAVFGFAGMQAPGEEVIFDPQLPPGWNSLAFAIQWRGQRVRIEIRDSALGSALELDVGAPGPAPEMPIIFQVGAQRLTVERAGRYRTEGSRGVWSPWNRQSP